MRRTLVPPLASPPAPPLWGGAVHTLHGRTMGTTWSVRMVTNASTLARLQQAIQAELDLVVAQMSTWDAASDLSRFNAATAGSWHPLPAEFFQVLQYGLQVAAASGGAYDPTAGALVNAWGFGPVARYGDSNFVAPDKEQLDAARALCGWQKLELDAATRCAHQSGGMYIDLSAIAKGYGVDQVARRLLQLGLEDFLVEVGGELRGEGVKPDGQPWWVALEQPLADAPACGTQHVPWMNETIAALHGWSVATSGDYRRYFETDHTRYSHTIDPRNGWPISNGLASVTVLHRESMPADAWSTALGVLGADEGCALANQLGLCALFLRRDRDGFVETLSEPLKALLD
ncbi:MAG TPA: FAD:protein FMN transferase [Oxalicibacterium sp.]|nr:FAD:protein FMN transferase [Oxalicibacterium sp.]